MQGTVDSHRFSGLNGNASKCNEVANLEARVCPDKKGTETSLRRSRLVLPKRIGNWSLTSLQQRLVKTGGRLIKHARYFWPAGGEPSDAAAVRGHAAADLGAAGVGRIGDGR